MEPVTIFVPGRPVPWQRATVNRRTGQTFTPPETREYEHRVAAFARQGMVRAGRKAFSHQAFMVATFYIPGDREKRLYRKGNRARGIVAGVTVHHANPKFAFPTRLQDGDTDNFLKAVKDGLVKGNALVDDRIVVGEVGWKEWAGDLTVDGGTRILLFDDVPWWLGNIAALTESAGARSRYADSFK